MKLPTILLVIALSMAISACNTIRGMGKDLERLGTAISRS